MAPFFMSHPMTAVLVLYVIGIIGFICILQLPIKGEQMKRHTVLITVFTCLSVTLGCSRKQPNVSAPPPEVLVTEI